MTTPWAPEVWTAPDGTRLSLRRAPAAGTPRASLVLVHGWGDHLGRFADVADWIAGRGISVFAVDQRGHGHSPGPRGHVERFAQYLADLAALRKLAAAEAPGPQFLLGHSFGAFIVLRYLETAPAGLAGAVAVAPFVDFFRKPPKWKVALARMLADILPAVPIPTGLDYDSLVHDRAQVQAFRDDPLAHERMTPRAYREAIAALVALWAEKDRIATPLLMLLAGDDRIVSTPSADAFAQALAADVTVERYPGMYHNVFQEPDRDRLYADLAAWLERRLDAAGAAA